MNETKINYMRLFTNFLTISVLAAIRALRHRVTPKVQVRLVQVRPRPPPVLSREKPRPSTPGDPTPRTRPPARADCTPGTAPPRPTRPRLRTRTPGSPPPRPVPLTLGSRYQRHRARAGYPGACHHHTCRAWDLTTRATCL